MIPPGVTPPGEEPFDATYNPVWPTTPHVLIPPIYIPPVEPPCDDDDDDGECDDDDDEPEEPPVDAPEPGLPLLFLVGGLVFLATRKGFGAGRF